MSKSSLVVGINDYLGEELYECVNDAKALSAILSYNQITVDHETRNFPACDLLVSPKETIDTTLLIDPDPDSALTAAKLKNAISELFGSASQNLLFYFSGHSDIDFRTGTGYLKTPDRMGDGEGVSFSEVMIMANNAGKANKNCLIILDTCNAGQMGQAGDATHSEIASGVTVIAAARSGQAAVENFGGGVFTRLLIEGLKGSAADIAGRITPASLYAYVDTSLSNFAQRPVYKSNVNKFMPIREVIPRVPLNTLRNLYKRFETEETEIKLSPEHDPTDRDKLPEKYKKTVPIPRKVIIYEEMRALNRNGMLVPVGVKHLYDAAMESKTVKLTELGKFYHRLSKAKVI